MATSGTKRKLCILTLRDRISVIKESEAGRSQRDLAKEFNCSKTQIQATLANREHYLRQWQENVNENSKRRRWQPYEDVNKALLDWLYHARSEHFPISGPMLQEKALQIASQLGLHRFHASNGWLNKFRTRHNIVFHPIAGATIEMREEDGAAWKDQLHVMAAGYADSDIYNMDETGLFFKAIPDKTLTVRSAQCQGGSWAEQRLTVALCANLCGDKEQPLVIHTATGGPHSTEALGIWRHTNRKAWMTLGIYRSWLEKLNERMRLQDRRILLFVDGAPCHCAEKLSHVEVTLLPTHGTPWSSPMCQGAIRAFKIHYRKKLLRSLLARMDDARPLHVLAEGITMVDALSWVKMAWDEVKPETITRGFLQSGFVPTVDVSHDDDEDLARSLAILNQLGKAADVSIDLENIDENMECFSREEDPCSDRLAREEEDPRSNRPAREEEKVPRSNCPAREEEKDPRSNRPAREEEKDPRSNRLAREEEKDPRSNRPAREEEKDPRSDCPARDEDARSDRPAREEEEDPRSDHLAREADEDPCNDRPAREEDPRSDRPAREEEEDPHSDRPAREEDPRSDHLAKEEEEEEDPRSDRPAREEEEGDCPASDLKARLPAEPMALEDALSSIWRHRALAAELGSPLLMDSLLRVETEYENIIVAKKFNHP